MNFKRLLVIMSGIVLLISMFTVQTFAAPSDFTSEIRLTETTLDGLKGIQVDYYLTSGTANVQVANLTFSYDDTIFDLLNNTTNAVYADDFISSATATTVDGALVGTVPSQFMLHNIKARKTGNMVAVAFSRNALMAAPVATATNLGGVFLAYTDQDFDSANLTTANIRFSTYNEIPDITTSVIQVAESGSLNYKIGNGDGTTPDTPGLASPILDTGSITLALPAYTDATNNVSTPAVVKSDRNKVTITAQSVTDQTVEYGMNTTTGAPTTWQASNVFENIAPGTYYFFARVQPKANVHTGGTPAISASTITVYAEPQVSYSNIPTAPKVSTAFNIYPSVTGGTGTAATVDGFKLTSGTLPAGLSLDSTSGAITGTPTATVATSTPLVITYTDSEANTATANVTIPAIQGEVSTVTVSFINADGSPLDTSTLKYGDVFYAKAVVAPLGTAGDTFDWSVSSGSTTAVEFADDDRGTPEDNVKKVTVKEATTAPVVITCAYGSTTHSGTGNATGLTFAKKELGLTVTASNKAYNHNTTAQVATASISGLASFDTAAEIYLSSSYGTGTFASEYVGTGINVTFPASSFTLQGTSAANYTLPASTTVTADITTATPSIATAYTDTKPYEIVKNGGDIDLINLVTGTPNAAKIIGTITTAPTTAGTAAIENGNRGSKITTTNGVTDETFAVTVYTDTINVNNGGDNEYGVSNSIIIYFKMVDKITDTSSMQVSVADITYGGTLSYRFTNPTTNNTNLSEDAAATYTYSGTLADGVTAYGPVAAAPTAAGTYTVTARKESDTHIFTATDTFTINQASIASASIVLGTALTYTGAEQTQGITSVTLNSTPLNLTTDYTVSGVTDKATDAGNYTLKIDGTGNYTGSATKSFTVAQAIIAPDTALVTKTFDGNNKATASTVTFTGIPAGAPIPPASDYTATGTYDTIDVGAAKDATLTVTLKAGTATAKNYKLSTPTLNINNAASITEKTIADVAVTVPILWNNVDEQTVNFATKIPSNAGSSDISIAGIVVDDATHSLLDPTITPTVDLTAKTIKFNLVDGLDKVTDKGDTVSFTARIESHNYADFNIIFTYEITDYIAPPVVPGTGVVIPQTVFPAAETANGAIINVARGSTPTFTFHEMTAENLAGLWIDGMAVDMNAVADIAYGSVIVTLKSSFTSTLANGEHTIHVVGKDGTFGFAKFYIGGHSNPQTSVN